MKTPAAVPDDTTVPDDTAVRRPEQPAHDSGLANLTPLGQLRAGKLARRLPQLMVGLTFFGVAMGLFVRARVGLDPWDVFHMGISKHTGLGMGAVTIIVSFVVLLMWIPLRQWPGLGTIANALWIGTSLSATLALVPDIDGLGWQSLVFMAGLVLNGLGGALYIGSQLGPGPRDGLMTGFHRRTGASLRLVRTVIEVTVLVIGWVLGGVVGVGTVIYALAIGPLTQFFLPHVVVQLEEGASK